MAAKNKFMNAMKMPAIADMFSSEADRQRESGDLVTEVPLSELHPFVNHPFEVRDDEDMCLDRITQQWDRGSTNTLLQTLALKQLHMESIPSLRQGAYKPDFTREKIAKLSYTVAEAAKAGDIDALRILDEASVCLADLAAAVARRVGNDELPVSLLGGTSHMGDIFTKRFEAALKEKLPQCSYRKPMFEPIVGAALFVMYEIVGRMDSREDFLKNIQAEWGTTYVNG